MKVAVLGSGVIGLTSAWYLAKAGHQVTVIDRQVEVAQETSFANAGQISYGYSSPWAAPGVPLKALKWLASKHAPLKVNPSLSLEGYLWSAKMLANCRQSRYSVNKHRMLKLANYSRACLADLRSELSLDYQGRQQGTLQVFRSDKQMDAVDKDMKLLSQAGIAHSLLNANECMRVEPGLACATVPLAGGLYLPEDETGDCRLFCLQLRQAAEQVGVEFMLDTHIRGFSRLDGSEGHDACITGVDTDKGRVTADAYLVAMGSYSPQLLSSIGVRVPVCPVKGYSLTLPILESSLAPQSTVMDESYKVAITGFDNRIRVAGMAELTDYDLSLTPSRLETLAMVVSELFPQGGDITRGEPWAGLRPMTPDGTPIIGRTHIKNLFTNTGHGTLGWTMAAGSGKLISDIISLNEPEFNHQGLDMFRYS